jgi:hypothetical protein
MGMIKVEEKVVKEKVSKIDDSFLKELVITLLKGDFEVTAVEVDRDTVEVISGGCIEHVPTTLTERAELLLSNGIRLTIEREGYC